MTPFTQLEGVAAPLPVTNIDTDAILAGRYLKTITRSGLGKVLFSGSRADPDFILNHAPWSSARILVALENFGCGSSREHAVWALQDFGIRCVIAPSIADIFRSNCLKNGVLPLVLERPSVNELLELATDPNAARLSVDLPSQTITASNGARYGFDIDAGSKEDLLKGTDEITRTLEDEDKITLFERRRAINQPYLELSQSSLRALSSLPESKELS